MSCTTLQELGGRLGAKRAEWKGFLETKGNGEFDFADPTAIKRFEEKNAEYNTEVSRLHDQYKAEEKVHRDLEENVKAIAELNRPTRGVPLSGGGPGGPGGGGAGYPTADQWEAMMRGMAPARKSIGELFGDQLKALKDAGVNFKNHAEFTLDDVDLHRGAEFKTTLTEATGFAPANYRSPLVVPYALRRPVVADLIPQFPTDQRNAIVYMEETTNTNNAAVVAEGAVKPESAFAFTQRTVNIEVIATTIPVSEQQLDDIPMLMAMINQRLSLHVQLAEETELLTGDGTAGVHLQGFLTKSGVLTQARGSDPSETAFFNAITQVRTTGFAEPDAGVIHPTNWATIVTHQTTIGSYVWANSGALISSDVTPGGAGFTQTANRLNAADFLTNPNTLATSLGVAGAADLGRNRLWGVPLVITPAMTLNTALVGEFQMYSALARRQGLNFTVGWANDDMLRNLRRIRAEERAALLILRPSAYCKITGLN
jgi:HK97 family phage major capsid protein